MAPQLPLDITLPSNAVFESYIAGDNALLLSLLKSISLPNTDEAETALYLWGERGVGKTHLLQASCAQANQQGLSAVYLPLGELMGYGIEAIEGMSEMQLVCIDDVHLVAGHPQWEVALFNMINDCRAKQHGLVMTGRDAAAALGIQLKDLVSRIGWGPNLQVKALSDAGKQQWIQSYCQEKGLYLDDRVAVYIINHHARDMSSLHELIKRLDHASWVEKKKLTLPFVKSVLDRK